MAAPNIQSITLQGSTTPITSASPGTSVIINGSGFTGANAVNFGSIGCPTNTFTVINDSQINATIPSFPLSTQFPDSVNVQVVVPNQPQGNPYPFTITSPPTSITLATTNNSGFPNSSVYYTVIGQDPNQGNAWVYLNANGVATLFSHSSPNNYALNLGTTPTITIPQLTSAQIYYSINQPVVIGTNLKDEQVKLVLPSGWTGTDPNYNILYDVVEFTFNNGVLNADFTQVDAFGIPMSMSAGNQSAGGWKKSRPEMFAQFKNNPLLLPLVVSNNKEIDLRIIAPGHGIDSVVFPSNYFDSYLQQSWSVWSLANPLLITYQGATYKGYTSGANTPMTIEQQDGGIVGSINYPTTQEVFECNGPFDQGNTIIGGIANIVAAAINRGILEIQNQPDCNVSDFYPAGGTYNLYSAVLHTLAQNGLCYGFPYDDQCGHSSDINVPNPTTWTITLEGIKPYSVQITIDSSVKDSQSFSTTMDLGSSCTPSSGTITSDDSTKLTVVGSGSITFTGTNPRGSTQSIPLPLPPVDSAFPEVDTEDKPTGTNARIKLLKTGSVKPGFVGDGEGAPGVKVSRP